MSGEEAWGVVTQRCSVGLKSGLRSDHLSSSTPALANPVFMDLAMCTGAFSTHICAPKIQ